MKKEIIHFSLLVVVLIVGFLYFVVSNLPHSKKDMTKTALKQPKIKKERIDFPRKIRVIALSQQKKVRKKIIKRRRKRPVLKAKKKIIFHHSKNNNFVRKIAYKKIIVNNNIIKNGRILLASNRQVPVIQTSYKGIGVYRYLKYMKTIGGRIFVGDALKKRIVGEAELYDTGCQYKFTDFIKQPGELSSMALFRPREIMDEPLAIKIVSRAKAQFGYGDFRCVIILPIDKEAAIIGGLDEYFKKEGYTISSFTMIKGRYLMSHKKLTLRLERGFLRKAGNTIIFDMELII